MGIFNEQASWRAGDAGRYIYKNGELEFFNQPEGYVEKDDTGYKYVYQYKDHLGNIRLSYKDANKDGNIVQSEIVEEKNYYPFGLTHKGYNNLLRGVDHNWDFLAQERQEEFGLNWLTFRYRNYMPEIGRFFGVDPITEEYHYITPYQFASNNPVWKIELEGLEGIEISGLDKVRQGFAKIWKAINPYSGVEINPNGGLRKTDSKARMREFVKGGVMVTDGVATKEVAHVVLDAAGTIDPTPISDGANALWYALDGEYGNASISLIGIIPYVGDGAKVGKYGSKALNLMEGSQINNLIKGAADKIIGLNKSLGDADGSFMAGGLESAINSASYYEKASDQGSAIFNSLAGGHIFNNGNKRTASEFIRNFANSNNLTLKLNNTQLQNLTTELATGITYTAEELSNKLFK